MVKEGYFPKATMGDETHLRKKIYSTNEVMQHPPKSPKFFFSFGEQGGWGWDFSDRDVPNVLNPCVFNRFATCSQIPNVLFIMFPVALNIVSFAQS
jgi:hypothetical protein